MITFNPFAPVRNESLQTPSGEGLGRDKWIDRFEIVDSSHRQLFWWTAGISTLAFSAAVLRLGHVPSRFYYGVTYRVPKGRLGQPMRLLDSDWILKVEQVEPGLCSITSAVPANKRQPFVELKQVQAGKLGTEEVVGKVGSARIWLADDRGVMFSILDAHLDQPVYTYIAPGSAAHRLLMDNRHLWEGQGAEIKNMSVVHLAANVFASHQERLFEAAAKGGTLTLPVYKTQGPWGHPLTHIFRWRYGQGRSVYFIQELGEDQKLYTTTLIPDEIYLTRPEEKWLKLTYAQITSDSKFPWNASLLVHEESTLGKALLALQARWVHEEKGVYYLSPSVFGEAVKVFEAQSSEVIQFYRKAALDKIGQLSSDPLARNASTEEMIRWALFDVKPPRRRA